MKSRSSSWRVLLGSPLSEVAELPSGHRGTPAGVQTCDSLLAPLLLSSAVPESMQGFVSL